MKTSKNKIEISKNIKFWPTSKLVPYEKNARTHSAEQVSQIAASILEFGFTNPILIDSQSGVIAGHGRLEAAKQLGLKEVPVILLDHLSKLQKRAYILADNKLALNAGWDEEILAEELAALLEAGYDTDVVGFSDKDLKDILPEEAAEENERADHVPEVKQNEFNVSLGDVYQLGEHRLMCGDSTDLKSVEKLMNGKKANICFTSPPYADQREYNGGKDLSTNQLVKFISVARNFCDFFAVNLGYSRKDNEVFCYWDDYVKEAKRCGLKFLSWNIWDRGCPRSIGQQTAMFPIEHEWIFIFGEKKYLLNNTVENISAGSRTGVSNRNADGTLTEKKPVTVRDARPLGTIIRTNVDTEHNVKHPAKFPVTLAQQYIETMTDEKGSVYEPFCGSGSTLIACEKTKRKCYGMELDPHYCSVIIKRWEEFSGKKAKKIFPVKTILKKKK